MGLASQTSQEHVSIVCREPRIGVECAIAGWHVCMLVEAG